MSYIYNVGYGTPEESEYIQLIHNNSFTKEEFDALIIEVTAEAIINKVKKHNSDYENNISYQIYIKLNLSCKEERMQLDTTFQDLLDPIMEILCKKYEFKKLEFTQSFSMFGWNDLLNADEWKSNMGDKSIAFTANIKEKLNKLEIPQNKELLSWQEMSVLTYDDELEKVVISTKYLDDSDKKVLRENLLEEWNEIISPQIDGRIVIEE